jgi:hypothetical protein
MRLAGIYVLLALACMACRDGTRQLATLRDGYVDEWIRFYPTAASSMGDRSAASRFEDCSADSVSRWIATNHGLLRNLEALGSDLSLDDRIDARLLRRNAELEIETWERDDVLSTSPVFYADAIQGSVVHLIARGNLGAKEMAGALGARMVGVRQLCRIGVATLRDGRPSSTDWSLRSLDASAGFFAESLPDLCASWAEGPALAELRRESAATAESVRALEHHIRDRVLPATTLGDPLGYETYARKLRAYIGFELAPKDLASLAAEEIDAATAEIHSAAASYVTHAYPDRARAMAPRAKLSLAFADLESRRVADSRSLLDEYRRQAAQAEVFIRDRRIAPLPLPRALTIELSPPQLLGWGGVSSPGPFAPDEATLFFLPWVPDSAGAEARDAFYRSFNLPFIAMITAHELLPGHYVHGRLAARNPRVVRSLFADGCYVEGWATMAEQIMLEAGWGDGDPLVRLVNLRKRLENGVRALLSVRAHCDQWDRARTTEYAVETGLMPPQFANYLWPRLANGPFQLVTYFLGHRAFREAYAAEQARLGPRFVVYDFCERALVAGTAPVDEVAAIVEAQR